MKWIFFTILIYLGAILVEDIINTINDYIHLKYGKEDEKEKDNLES